MGPKIKKRPLTLSSPETPEQPSPRTARAQDTVPLGNCKFHLRASAWHKAGIRWLAAPGRLGLVAVEHFLLELVYCESLTQRLYISMQLFALSKRNRIYEIQRKLLLFKHIKFVLLWNSTCTYEGWQYPRFQRFQLPELPGL
jgi:hypothetical protein